MTTRARPVSDLDIYRTANLVIRQCGSNAEHHAAQRADQLLDQGDMEGRRTWLRVLAALKELRAGPEGQTKH